MNRRRFLTSSLAATTSAVWLSNVSANEQSAAAAVEQAHAEIWRRFIDRHGVMIDFAAMDGSVSLPTPEECRAGKPNALGWWSPIENGPMFNGLYMDAAVNRWRHTKADADAAKARRLMEGLLLLASVSEVRGMVARGVSTDGRTHYAMGSNDQMSPWFLGLWRYLDTGLATQEERARITAKLVEVTDAIVQRNWAIPAEPPFGKRGSFAGFEFDSAPRLLFVCKLLHAVTGDAKWNDRYRTALAETGGPEKLTREQICERGMTFHYAKFHSWTSCTCVGAVRALWDMEKDAATRAAYARGLQASADLAFKSLPLAERFDNADTSRFEMDWRVMNRMWKPQQTETEAQQLALAQLREFLKVAPRRAKETEFIREPTAAAWVVTLAPDATVLKQRAAAVERVIAHYDYSRLYYSQFFWVECAWWRLKAVR
ncbi:MAG: hypothetical protein HZA92_18525 [Verrucomicrobia bacterium]|nr:hypothetical protein [Verrucomicrobiota bacterium]